MFLFCFFFFFQAEDGIRDIGVTGVQTCALPICIISGSVSLAKAKSFTSLVAHADPALVSVSLRG